ncbi:MAG: winged helix-turn-helix domain-containing protein [Candidatus Omnitrophica bacterium]|nr:winged helix-turn-helix domain-containing protein [Candidatus Omnitrophota bacterium]
MILEIGIVAGDIWHYLDEHGLVTLPKLIKGINQPKQVVLMSLGWLAREGHVKIEANGEYKVCLTKKSEFE